MCGRFALSSPANRIVEHFTVREWFENDAWAPRYNIAPSQPVVIVRNAQAGDREVAHTSWGLIASWSKDPTGSRRPINARSETAAEKPTFRAAMKYRRCLIPADAFYEWQVTPSGKIPHAIKMADEELFAFAGLWEHWQGGDGSELETCAILTTQANPMMAKIHERMPVIVAAADYEPWLSGEPQQAAQLLRPYPAELMMNYPISNYVNSPRHDSEKCLEPADGEPPTLFG